MPDPERLLRTLYKAGEAVRLTPGRKGRLIQIPSAADILVVGDLHGHIGNFQAAYQAADLAHNPNRHFVLQEIIHGKQAYAGGGDKSHQLLDLFAALKCQFPGQVHLILGNHEVSQWMNRMVMKEDRDLNAGFREGVIEAYGAKKGDEIYNTYVRLFGSLPLAIRTPNRIFISHSLPREKAMERFQLRHFETDAFPAEDMTIGGSVYEMLWGRDVREQNCSAYLKKVDSDWLITGHVSCDAGYAFPSPRHLIVDCSDLKASYALLPAGRPLTETEFRASVRLI